MNQTSTLSRALNIFTSLQSVLIFIPSPASQIDLRRDATILPTRGDNAHRLAVAQDPLPHGCLGRFLQFYGG